MSETNEKEKDQVEQTNESKKVTTDAAIDAYATGVGKQLAKQKKVKVKLYLSTEDRQKLEASANAGKKVVWPTETVNINGYTIQIQRGKEVEVPQSVYEILEQANII